MALFRTTGYACDNHENDCSRRWWEILGPTSHTVTIAKERKASHCSIFTELFSCNERVDPLSTDVLCIHTVAKVLRGSGGGGARWDKYHCIIMYCTDTVCNPQWLLHIVLYGNTMRNLRPRLCFHSCLVLFSLPFFFFFPLVLAGRADHPTQQNQGIGSPCSSRVTNTVQ